MMPETKSTLVAGWLTTGRWEGVVCGLGIPVGLSGGNTIPTGDRGCIVLMKPVNSGGGKAARKSESGVNSW
jgi:hypothetical protein